MNIEQIKKGMKVRIQPSLIHTHNSWGIAEPMKISTTKLMTVHSVRPPDEVVLNDRFSYHPNDILPEVIPDSNIKTKVIFDPKDLVLEKQ